jgi:hypothetical protein
VLPPRTVRARNLFRDHPNRIHDDAVARQHGFAGGLVAGTTLYGYLTQPVVAALGPAWLERGTARVRCRRPVYEGDLVTVRARVVARSGGPGAGEVLLALEAETPRAGVAVAGTAGLAWGGPPVVPDPASYPRRPLGARRAASAAVLGRPGPLGTPVLDVTAALAVRTAEELEDPWPLYRAAPAVAHPALLLQQANRALSENVALGPWLHVESDLAHGGLARAGERLVTAGRVARLFERGGHRLVELDVLVTAGEDRPVVHVRHTAIWQLAAGPGA